MGLTFWPILLTALDVQKWQLVLVTVVLGVQRPAVMRTYFLNTTVIAVFRLQRVYRLVKDIFFACEQPEASLFDRRIHFSFRPPTVLDDLQVDHLFPGLSILDGSL